MEQTLNEMESGAREPNDEAGAREEETPRDEPQEQPGVADQPEPEEEGTGRPPLVVIIGSVLLLVAIGAGLATIFTPPPQEPALPTAQSQPAPAGTPAADVPVPTSVPLPEAIGEFDDPEPIAQVGDTNITRGDFVRLYEPGGNPLEVLDQMIQVELVVQAALAEGVEADEAAITAQVEEIKLAQAGGDSEKFVTFLRENNISSEEKLRDLIRRDQLIQQMILRYTTVEQAHARHILLSAEADQIEARKAEAEALLKEIEDGGDFVALAREKSEDPGSKENGGDLGWAPRGLFVPPFDEAVFSMEVGEVRLVQSDFGWHIIELLDAPEVRAFDDEGLLQTPPGRAAFEATFLPWAEKLKQDAEAAQKIKILVKGEDLVTLPNT